MTETTRQAAGVTVRVPTAVLWDARAVLRHLAAQACVPASLRREAAALVTEIDHWIKTGIPYGE